MTEQDAKAELAALKASFPPDAAMLLEWLVAWSESALEDTENAFPGQSFLDGEQRVAAGHAWVERLKGIG